MITVPSPSAAVRAAKDGSISTAQFREMICGASTALCHLVGAAADGCEGAIPAAAELLVWIETVAHELTYWDFVGVQP